MDLRVAGVGGGAALEADGAAEVRGPGEGAKPREILVDLDATV